MHRVIIHNTATVLQTRNLWVCKTVADNHSVRTVTIKLFPLILCIEQMVYMDRNRFVRALYVIIAFTCMRC